MNDKLKRLMTGVVVGAVVLGVSYYASNIKDIQIDSEQQVLASEILTLEDDVTKKSDIHDTDVEIPEAIYEKFKVNFTNPDLVDKEQLQLVKVKMRGRDSSQIGVYTNLDHLNGGFALYELENGEYKEVYSAWMPVYGVEIVGNLLVLTTGLGGTGMQENTMSVVKYIENEGYRDVWSGMALKISFGGPPPYFIENGSISINTYRDEIVYSKTKRVYNNYDVQEDRNVEPDQTLNMIEIYRYNAETNMFELIGE